MGKFTLDVKGAGVHMQPRQVEAVMALGGQLGGKLEVHQADHGAVMIFASAGGEYVVQPDGRVARVK